MTQNGAGARRIAGVGVDLCDVARFSAALERTPSLGDRLFTPQEREGRRPEQLAARFAAKEAVAKALGMSYAGSWHDVCVRGGGTTAPDLVVTGAVAAAAAAKGIVRWHLSLSHDGGFAIAFVVAEA